nr:GNAT family N-acetyltransferase [Planosporangium thailandense]
MTSARDAAERDAREGMRRAGVTVRPLHSAGDCVAAATLLAAIWGTAVESSPLQSDLLTSLGHAGGCVLGAVDTDGTIVGVAVGVGGAPQSDRLYSLIAGVHADHAGRGVGLALKQTQRLWALERGATTMAWTYDPLVRRNAHFNLNRLGASAVEYVPDFYPPMHDAVNRSDLTDRLTVVWDLVAPTPGDGGNLRHERRLLEPADDGGPRAEDGEDGDALAVWIPPDIEGMRRGDPVLAMRWRLAVRDALGGAFQAGFRARRITTDGYYILTRGDDRP